MEEGKTYFSASEYIDDLIEICYGRLNLSTEQIENLCPCEITHMINGWERRYKDLRDLLIVFCTLPILNSNPYSKHRYKYEDIVPEEKVRDDLTELSEEELRELAGK